MVQGDEQILEGESEKMSDGKKSVGGEICKETAEKKA